MGQCKGSFHVLLSVILGQPEVISTTKRDQCRNTIWFFIKVDKPPIMLISLMKCCKKLKT